MKAEKQAMATGVKVVLSLSYDENVTDANRQNHRQLRIKLADAVVTAMAGNLAHQVENNARAAAQQDLFKADAQAEDVRTQIRSIQFMEGLLQARTHEKYADKRDEETVVGHIDVSYRSATSGALVNFSLSRRVPLAVIDALNEVLASDVVEVVELAPAQKLVEESTAPAKTPKAESKVRNNAEMTRQAPQDHKAGGLRREEPLPMLAGELINIAPDMIRRGRLTVRESALFMAGKAAGIDEAMSLLEHYRNEALRSTQNELLRLHMGDRKPLDSQRKGHGQN